MLVISKWVMIAIFFLFSPHLSADETYDLHKYLLEQDVPGVQSDLDKVKQFVNSGASVSDLGPTGGNAVSVAIESWANVVGRGRQTQENELFLIVEYLIAEGSDPGKMDWRGLNPLIMTMSWAFPGPEFDKMIQLILSKASNFDQVSADGIGLIHYFASGGFPNLGLELIARGMPIRLIDRYGRSFAHLGAQRGEYKGYHFLKEVFQKLSPYERSLFSELPTNYGMRPLHFAAMRGSLTSARYLVEELGVAVSPLTLGGETPLDIAIRENKTEVADYLSLLGGIQSQTMPEPLSCTHQNISMKVSYYSIKQLVEKCRIKSIAQLLRLLPASYLSHHLTAYFTLAAQEASPDFPQIMTFGRDGKLMLAFNGHKTQDGFKGLDIIEFNEVEKTFELRAITFPESSLGKAEFSEKNPARCIGCHGSSPRPLWNSWTTWPGKFGAEVDHIFPRERKYFERYQKNRNLGRYSYLPPLSLVNSESAFGVGNLSYNRNTSFDSIVDGLNSQKIARELGESRLVNEYRYAILGALSCNEQISAFIPSQKSNRFPVSFDFLKEDTSIKSDQEELGRLSLLKRTLGVEPQSRYVLQAKFFRNRFSSEQAGRNFDLNRTAWLRYVLENNFYDMSIWSTNFNNGKNSYVPNFNWAGLERFAWNELLDPIRDSELYTLYNERIEDSPNSFFSSNVFYKQATAESERVCEILKRKSLSALH